MGIHRSTPLPGTSKQPFREVGIPLQIQIPLPDSRNPHSRPDNDDDKDTYGISFPMSDGPDGLTISPDDDDIEYIPMNGASRHLRLG